MIIFLDVDGVLNTSESLKFDFNRMIPSRVNNFKTLLETLDAKFILSSDWRFGMIQFWNSLEKASKEANIDVSFFKDRFDGTTLDFGDREREILSEVEDKQITDFLVLDDLFIFNGWINMIRTDEDSGFDVSKLEEALERAKLLSDNKDGWKLGQLVWEDK